MIGSINFFLMIKILTKTKKSYLSDTLGFGIVRLSKGWMIAVSLIMILLAGCSGGGKKLHIQNPGEYEVQFYHHGSSIELWTDFDVEFVEPLTMLYQLSFYQEGELVAQVSCDPFAADEKRMQRYVENNGLVKVSYLGQMQCSVELPEGETLISVHFEAQATSFKIFRADLILK